VTTTELTALRAECVRIRDGYPDGHKQHKRITEQIENIDRRIGNERKTNTFQRSNGQRNP
jgi:hypothetical protein